MTSTLLENLYLSGMEASNAFLPWMWPIVSGSIYFLEQYPPFYGVLTGVALFLAGEAWNLCQSFPGNSEALSSLPEIILAEIPGVLTAIATVIVSNEYLFPNYPLVSAILAGFMGYEAFIQTCERQNPQTKSPSVLAKPTFWIFTLLSSLAIYFA